MPRKRLNWHWNEERQEFATPSGRTVSLHEIAGLLADYAQCRIDLAGAWSGWKIRGNRLIPPGGSMRGPAITTNNATAFARWLNDPAAAPSQPHISSGDRPRLRLVYTRCP